MTDSLRKFKDGHVWLTHWQTFILLGKIQFDNKHERFATSFGLNPLRKAAAISKKPNDLDIKATENMKNFDEDILTIVKRTTPQAYRRHIIPVSENQTYGWDSPSLSYDRSNIMLHYGRRRKLYYK